MAINQKVAAFFSGLALAGSLGLAKVVKAEEFNPNGWPIPDITRVEKGAVVIKNIIKTSPDEETIVRAYKTPQGTYFNTLSIIKDGKEIIYGYYIDTDGKPPMEYTLIDHQGDGIFRHRYGGDEYWPIPRFLLDLFSKK
jgi:hypothetical protein